MAEQKDITVRAKTRAGRGKNDARRARREGMVPISVYGGEGGGVIALAPLRDLAAILRSESGRNTIFTLDIEGVGSSEVMFHERQIDPVRGRLIHADLTRLVKGQKIEVRCEPREIPDVINVDVSNLGVHDVLHISDIPIDERIEILNPPETVIATVGIIKEEPVAAPVVEVEGPTEPEVIGKGKKEEEEGTGEAEKGKKE